MSNDTTHMGKVLKFPMPETSLDAICRHLSELESLWLAVAHYRELELADSDDDRYGDPYVMIPLLISQGQATVAAAFDALAQAHAMPGERWAFRRGQA